MQFHLNGFRTGDPNVSEPSEPYYNVSCAGPSAKLAKAALCFPFPAGTGFAARSLADARCFGPGGC